MESRRTFYYPTQLPRRKCDWKTLLYPGLTRRTEERKQEGEMIGEQRDEDNWG